MVSPIWWWRHSRNHLLIRGIRPSVRTQKVQPLQLLGLFEIKMKADQNCWMCSFFCSVRRRAEPHNAYNPALYANFVNSQIWYRTHILSLSSKLVATAAMFDNVKLPYRLQHRAKTLAVPFVYIYKDERNSATNWFYDSVPLGL